MTYVVIFSALDGSGDAFETVQELVRNCRPGFSMDLGKVPYAPFGDGYLSSYITDFFVHGRLEFLQKDNLLGASESWRVVHDWVETLEVSCWSMECHCRAFYVFVGEWYGYFSTQDWG